MKVLSHARRLARVLKPPVIINSAADHKLLSSDIQFITPHIRHQWKSHRSFYSHSLCCSGNYLRMVQQPVYLRTAEASFSTEATAVESNPTEAVKELYDKILESVNVKRTMAPNAWLWSLIANCKNHEDIKLLFDTLQNLRRFRLSNLRIPTNFNDHLCREVTKACALVGAIDFGDTESLWKIEKLRSESMQQRTLVSGFSCAKGLILERKPKDAAAVIQVLNQTLSDTKKSGIVVELQKLVSEWPLDVVKHQPEENRKALATALKSDIPAMVAGLVDMGLEANVNLGGLTSKEEIFS